MFSQIDSETNARGLDEDSTWSTSKIEDMYRFEERIWSHRQTQ